jgi:hypothetical protein
MHRKQKIAATELLHSWFYGRTLTISELQCRSGKSPHSSTGPPGRRACPAHEAGWMARRKTWRDICGPGYFWPKGRTAHDDCPHRP